MLITLKVIWNPYYDGIPINSFQRIFSNLVFNNAVKFSDQTEGILFMETLQVINTNSTQVYEILTSSLELLRKLQQYSLLFMVNKKKQGNQPSQDNITNNLSPWRQLLTINLQRNAGMSKVAS